MKSPFFLLLTALLTLSLFAGCNEKEAVFPEDRLPISTTEVTLPRKEPVTEMATDPVHTVSPEDLASMEATIEDGNGPIPSQNLLPRTR